MDTRYKDRGYNATFTETAYAAGMEIRKGKDLLVGVTFAFVDGGRNAKPKVVVQVWKNGAIGETIVETHKEED